MTHQTTTRLPHIPVTLLLLTLFALSTGWNPNQLSAIYADDTSGISVAPQTTIRQLSKLLADAGVAGAEELEALASDPEFVKSLGIEGESIEGYIAPGHYPVQQSGQDSGQDSGQAESTCRQLLSAMTARFLQQLPDDYDQQIKQRNLSLHQAVTMASLIELEALDEVEYAFFAEVIWNRLHDRQPLVLDSAIRYGAGNFDQPLTLQQMSDRGNLYNTRMHIGLPPGPITTPSPKALLAVVKPSTKGYRFFVKDPQENIHLFARDRDEYQAHVQFLLGRMQEELGRKIEVGK